MITLYGPKLPRSITLAVSGGIDSMVALDFLRRNHDLSLIHINHREGNSEDALIAVERSAKRHGLALRIVEIMEPMPKATSHEAWWRSQRYAAFKRIDGPVVTCHHLDDCVETWVWSSMHGTPKLIPYRHANVIRPFLLTKKDDLTRWAVNSKIDWIEDASNLELKYTRNYIRRVAMPHVLQINPGIQKMIRKKLIQRELNEHANPIRATAPEDDPRHEMGRTV